MCQFESLSADVEIIETLYVDYIIRGLAHYATPCEFSVKTEARNAPWNEKPGIITVICYATGLTDLNEYLSSFPGATLTDKIGVTELNEIILNGMPTSCYIQAYVQGFYCESITLKIC